MTSAQKIIKYFAIAFAFALIFGILSCIMFGLSQISTYFNDNDSDIIDELKEMNIDTDNVSVLDIDIKYANLIIKTGDKLNAETNNKYITTSQKGNKLIISEKKHSWFNNDKSDLVVYIPEDLIFDGISIEAGAGKIEIDNLSTKILEFDLGAGKTDINNLVVLGSAEIDGGAGEITISDGSINNLDLDTGVGKCTLISELIGKNEIDVGVGELNITLLGNKENYRVSAEKGIGSIKLDNEDIKSSQVYGIGQNSIDISGGVGSINIKFK
ncbi:MAG: DUF4097 family beta strand repeat protein [Bacilli bacterium]|nr:DUF4097 family beta strand repeat protein [Bacilli bacterium]